jgi:hypothetical protein
MKPSCMRAVLALFLASFTGCGGLTDDDATGSDKSKASRGAGDAPTNDGPANGGAGSAPVRPACALQAPVRQDFDRGFASLGEWGAVPGGLQFEDAQPITGAQSLKIDVARARMYGAFITRSLPSSCALSLKMNLRSAPLFGADENATLVRFSAKPAFLDLVLGENGQLSIVEITPEQARVTVPGPGGGPGPAPSVGPAHPIGVIAADVTASVVVSLDLSANRVSGSVTPMGSPPPAEVSSSLTIAHGDLMGVVIGRFSGSATTGTYVLDDVVLE